MSNKENAIQLPNTVEVIDKPNVLPPAFKTEASDLCDRTLFLSKIRKHVLKYQDTNKEDHINNVELSFTLKKAEEFFDTLQIIKKTIIDLSVHPVLLSAFFTGVNNKQPEYYDCISLDGKYRIETINFAINEHVL